MEKKHEMIAIEAFIRRAAEVGEPFMLKGSYVTRQYFANPEDRLPNDLDWLYLQRLTDVENASYTFHDWAKAVTETQKEDGVKFRSFAENSFWRMIDYAMSDDFPTVNTDILCWIGKESLEFSMDVSFNLDVSVEPVSLEYNPLQGDSFTVPVTAPLSLQIAWKLHQTLVRPRFKDIFDLTHLLKHPSFDEQMRHQSLQALVDECYADKVNVKRLEWLIKGDLEEIYKPYTAKREWHFWRTGEYLGNHLGYETSKWITNLENLPKNLHTFAEQFSQTMQQAGFTIDVLDNLPTPKKYKSKQNQEDKGLLDSFWDWFK
ncbi:MAG: nucleotidyl transferase AbiEii/AbiGii toxin family protein [Pyrinomonadaceae bacterium]|nr:nucleotidyl transferase AbiEii/AbiGii toxin family protein [Pyrinomonadaceae bacterium]